MFAVEGPLPLWGEVAALLLSISVSVSSFRCMSSANRNTNPIDVGSRIGRDPSDPVGGQFHSSGCFFHDIKGGA